MSSTTMVSARLSSRTASEVRSTPGMSSNRNAKRAGVGVGLVMTASMPRSRSRCASPASLPSPSPSGLTCVVRQTRCPGTSAWANDRAAAVRSGARENGMRGT